MWVFWNNISQRRGAHGTSAPNLQLAVGPPYNVRDPASFHRLSAPPPPPLSWRMLVGGGALGDAGLWGRGDGDLRAQAGDFFHDPPTPPPNPGGKDVVWRGGLGDHVLWSGLGPSGSVKGWEWWLHKKSMCDLRDHYPARRGRGLDAVQRPIAWNPVGGFFGYHGSLFEKNENVI